ncbi:hypothetical protein BGX26_000393 [Mortierella sp. AD094]|nr:hypothetical protein BGX26_000393 [Mortierella sp. AD094]
MPELIDRVVQYVVPDIDKDLEKAQETIRHLRLVSRAFFQAANPYFAVYLNSPTFQRFKGYQGRINYQEKISVCGPLIQSIDLRTGHFYDFELIELIGDCCPALRHVTLSFQDRMHIFPRPNYSSLFKRLSFSYVSSSFNTYTNTNTNNNNNNNNIRNRIKFLTAILRVNRGLVNEFVIDASFVNIRKYLARVENLNVEAEFENPPGENPICISDKPLSGDPSKASSVDLPYMELPFLNLAIIRKLNLMFPNLEYLAINKLAPVPNFDNRYRYGYYHSYGQGEGEGEGGVWLSQKLTVKSMQIQVANANELHKLLKVAPQLKSLVCYKVRVQHGLARDLAPSRNRVWDCLELEMQCSKRSFQVK